MCPNNTFRDPDSNNTCVDTETCDACVLPNGDIYGVSVVLTDGVRSALFHVFKKIHSIIKKQKLNLNWYGTRYLGLAKNPAIYMYVEKGWKFQYNYGTSSLSCSISVLVSALWTPHSYVHVL